MRKMKSGLAIAGGILCIVAVFVTLLNILSMLRAHLPAEYLVRNITPNGITALTTLLLAVVLFRRKADTFAGIICLVNIPMALYTVWNNITTVIFSFHGGLPAYRTVLAVLYILGNLLKAAAFVMMAMQAFKKKPGKNMLCVALAIAAVALIALAGIYNTVSILTGGTGFGILFRNSRAFSRFAGDSLKSILGILFLALAGLSFSHTRSGDDSKQPQYQQYQAPQYQAPQYQAPQYQAPQYQQPQYQQYQAPQYQQPQYQAPQYQQPQYQAPQYQAPQYQAPQYQAPQYQAPQYQAPQYQEPQQEPPCEQ